MALHPSAQRKPSFFRRLSASSESPPVVYASDQAILSGQPSYAPKNALRSTSGPSKRGLLAGPAYETLPFVIGQAGETTVQPTTSDRSRDRLLHNNGDAQPADRRGSSGIPKYLPSTSSEADVPIRLQASLSRSPPISAPPSASSPSAHPVLANNRQQRQPIHPALASPPNSPPRVRQEGSSHLTDSFQSIPTFPNSGVGSGQVRPSIVSLENVHPAPRDGRGRQASGEIISRVRNLTKCFQAHRPSPFLQVTSLHPCPLRSKCSSLTYYLPRHLKARFLPTCRLRCNCR